MDDLKQCSLEELIERVIKERLIDSCERNDDHVVIVQGAMRFVLNPIRAHAFLRGVIKGMSARYRRGWRGGGDPIDSELFSAERTLHTDVPESGLIDSFRRHLLKKWWARYEEALCPFGQSSTALMLWVRHNTGTTAN